MSEHRATIEWSGGSSEFTYDAYPRDHLWTFEDGIEIPASSAPDFLGTPSLVDPEEALVASIASCHMLTFLAIAAKKRFVVESYTDSAVGTLEELRVLRIDNPELPHNCCCVVDDEIDQKTGPAIFRSSEEPKGIPPGPSASGARSAWVERVSSRLFHRLSQQRTVSVLSYNNYCRAAAQ